MGNRFQRETNYAKQLPCHPERVITCAYGSRWATFLMLILMSSVILILFSGFLYAAEAPQPEPSVIEKIPRTKEKVSTSRAMILDIAPGVGHFYLGNYGNGVMFGLLKISTMAASWYYYSQWQDSKTKYHRASADQMSKYKLRSDRAAQRMTFSVIGAGVIYAASWIKVYSDCQDRNADSFPVFDVGFRDDMNQKTRQFYCGTVFHF
jgi:hypothetical protein